MKMIFLVKNMLMIYSFVVFNSLITRDRVTLSFIQVRINQAWCLILHSDVDSNPTCCNRVVTQESELCHYRWGIFKTFLLGTHFTVNIFIIKSKWVLNPALCRSIVKLLSPEPINSNITTHHQTISCTSISI